MTTTFRRIKILDYNGEEITEKDILDRSSSSPFSPNLLTTTYVHRYHAHIYGLSDEQVFLGMSGMFLVEGKGAAANIKGRYSIEFCYPSMLMPL